MEQNKYPRFRPLINDLKDNTHYRPLFMTYNENNILSSKIKFYLREEVPEIYELCSRKLTKRNEVTGIKVHCPFCNKVMFPFSAYQDEIHLQKYVCKNCHQ